MWEDVPDDEYTIDTGPLEDGGYDANTFVAPEAQSDEWEDDTTYSTETTPEVVEEAPKEETMVGKAMDFLLVPKEEHKDTDAFKHGMEDGKKTKPVDNKKPFDLVDQYVVDDLKTPTEPGKLKKNNAIHEWFSNETYGVDQVTAYMKHYMDKGMKKNAVLKQLKEEGASPLDMTNASYYGRNVKAPSNVTGDLFKQGAKRGLARTGMAIAQTSVNIADGLGADTTAEQDKLDYAKGVIKAEHDEMEQTYDMQSPVETMVKYAPEVLTMGISGGWKTVATAEAGVEYALSRADGFSVGQSLTRAATIGTATGGLTKVMDGKSLLNADGLTEEAQNLLTFSKVAKGTEAYDTVVKSLKGVDADDQVRIVAEQLGDRSKGAIDQAMKHMDDSDRIAYAERLAQTRKDYAEATGLDDIEGIEAATKAEYDLMRDALKNMSGGQTFDVGSLLPRLNELSPFTRNDFGVSKIDNIVENIQMKPTKSLDEIMDIRQELNAEWNKATPSARKMIEEVKASIDNYFRTSGVSPKTIAMMDDTINSYSRMSKQKELSEIMENNTKTLGKGSEIGEVKVTNWGAMLEEVKAAKLGKTVEDEVKLLEKLSKKYGSTQADRVVGSRTKGESDIAQTLSSSVAGAAKVLGIRKLIEGLLGTFPTNAGKSRRIQRAIAKSMKKNKSYEDFASDLIKDKNVPLNIKARIQTHLEGIEDEIEAAKANPAPKFRDKEMSDKATSAQQKIAKGLDAKLKRQQLNINKEIRARFRTKRVSADDRLEHARIEEKLITAQNSGNREAVKDAMSELDAFNEHTKNLPKRETSVEAAKRIDAEKEVARAERVEQARVARETREAAAAQRAERLEAERVLQEEASRANAERVARARRQEREAIADAERQAEANRPPAPPTPQQLRATANDNMVDTLNEELTPGWEVRGGNTGNSTHPEFVNRETGSSFTLHIYPDSMGATTMGLHNGSGEGSKVYHAIFDMAEELGVYYKPSSSLMTANPVRMGLNMVTYMAKRGTDAPHVMIGTSQKGIGNRGNTNYLGGKRLTLDNANQLLMGLKGVANRKLPNGINITARTTDEELETMAKVTGGDPNMRLGPSSLKLIRDFLASGRNLSTMGAVAGLMMMDEELMSFLEDEKEI